jgi:tRNA1Val (adenine37-N6)-methyltransferase
MSTDTFQFKQFTIAQERTAMKVGTDGVLLGAWAPIPALGTNRLLDVGGGTGLVALMLAQRFSPIVPDLQIEAVEIDTEAAQQAKENVAATPWNTVINIQNISFQDFVQKAPANTYDLIVSNPPFFTETLKSPEERRNLARHTDALPFGVLLSGVEHLLNEEGAFAMIYPANADGAVQAEAVRCRLHCSDLCEVKTTIRKPAKRLMAVFRKKVPDYIFKKGALCIHDEGGVFSEAYRTLTQDFYLDF